MISPRVKNAKPILLMVASSICVCFGQLFWKVSIDQGSTFLLFGFVLYIAGSALMLIAYRFGSLSVLHPLLSLNYVLTSILGFMVLNESMQPLKIWAIVLVTIGVILIGGSRE
jgi:drug/metabolite transporter (DMT)-like permease